MKGFLGVRRRSHLHPDVVPERTKNNLHGTTPARVRTLAPSTDHHQPRSSRADHPRVVEKFASFAKKRGTVFQRPERTLSLLKNSIWPPPLRVPRRRAKFFMSVYFPLRNLPLKIGLSDAKQ